MRIAILGVGQAGGKIAEALLDYRDRTETDFVSGVLAVNSASADLLALGRIPMKNRILVGQSRVKGNGAGANNELGSLIATEDAEEVMEEVAEFPVEKTDAFLVVAGLGGGTGSGGAPVFASELSERYTEPVYGLGVLPSTAESGIYQLNAARSFKTFVGEVDNLVVVDNDAWQTPDQGSLAESYGHINREVAKRMGVLFTASDVYGPGGPEMVVDATEVMNTLGAGGISSLGYATTEIERQEPTLADRVFGRVPPPVLEGVDTANQIASLVRVAAMGQLSLPCELSSAERVLVVVAGPPEYLSRRGLERAVAWLEAETGTREVRGGDCPLPDENKVGALVLLSGITDVPRLDRLREEAIETQERLAQIRGGGPDAVADSSWSVDEEIESLY